MSKKKPPGREALIIRGKKGGLSELVLFGASGLGTNSITSIGFYNCDKRN
jgi:hypothetical protein